jgi:hypothetical protein
MTSTNGSAAVAPGGVARICEDEPESFLETELRAARRAAALAAGALVAACERNTPPAALGKVAQRALLAAGELRAAARAVSIPR